MRVSKAGRSAGIAEIMDFGTGDSRRVCIPISMISYMAGLRWWHTLAPSDMDRESDQAGIDLLDGGPGHGVLQSLSPREREVLALVAAGLTNRAISERLVISIGTTDRHVHNILAKLGCATRTEAAAFARLPSDLKAEARHCWRPDSAPGSVPAQLGVFIGRTAEMSRLMGRLGEAAAGSGGLTMVVGEPGIGKTRLTEEVAR